MAKKRQANPFSLRIDKRVMEALKVIAEQEGRSVNKQIEYIVKKYLDETKGSAGEKNR